MSSAKPPRTAKIRAAPPTMTTSQKKVSIIFSLRSVDRGFPLAVLPSVSRHPYSIALGALLRVERERTVLRAGEANGARGGAQRGPLSVHQVGEVVRGVGRFHVTSFNLRAIADSPVTAQRPQI